MAQPGIHVLVSSSFPPELLLPKRTNTSDLLRIPLVFKEYHYTPPAGSGNKEGKVYHRINIKNTRPPMSISTMTVQVHTTR